MYICSKRHRLTHIKLTLFLRRLPIMPNSLLKIVTSRSHERLIINRRSLCLSFHRGAAATDISPRREKRSHRERRHVTKSAGIPAPSTRQPSLDGAGCVHRQALVTSTVPFFIRFPFSRLSSLVIIIKHAREETWRLSSYHEKYPYPRNPISYSYSPKHETDFSSLRLHARIVHVRTRHFSCVYGMDITHELCGYLVRKLSRNVAQTPCSDGREIRDRLDWKREAHVPNGAKRLY